MLAPIALYPDPVLAVMLQAAVNPQEVMDGGNWLGVDDIALVAYPAEYRNSGLFGHCSGNFTRFLPEIFLIHDAILVGDERAGNRISETRSIRT